MWDNQYLIYYQTLVNREDNLTSLLCCKDILDDHRPVKSRENLKTDPHEHSHTVRIEPSRHLKDN